MDKIVRRLQGKYIVFPVYTVEEAEAEGIKYVGWRDAQVGDWALSDDDYVGLCYDRRTYRDGKHTRDAIWLCYGVVWSSTKNLSYLERKAKKAFHATSPRGWREQEARNQRSKNAVKLYVEQFLGTGQIDWDQIGRAYRPDQRVPAATVRRLFKAKIIQDMIRREVKRALQDGEVTEETVIDMFKDTFDLAKDERQPASMARVAENFSDMLHMKDKDDTPLLSGLEDATIIDETFDELEAATKELPQEGTTVKD